MSKNNEKNDSIPEVISKPLIESNSSTNLYKNILETPLEDIAVNPFITENKLSTVDYIKIYGLGSVLFAIRIIPLGFFAGMAAILASLAMNCIYILKLLRVPTKRLKRISKNIVFGCLRCALFSCGYFWIKINDKRGEYNCEPNVIPVAPHTSFWDIIALIILGGPAIVSRYENSKMPLVGSILQLCSPVLVKREDKDSRTKATNDIKSRALVGKIMLFPEGTCTNGLSLIQFKMGAFLPQLPVQPVVIKWNVGKHDFKSWTEEGAGIIQILFHTLGQLWTSCEITKLPPYIPNEDEKLDARLFADNVEKVMCDELGVIQSFYSYDDVMFMRFAKEIRIFRSPVCLKLLSISYKIAKEKSVNQSISGSALSKTIKAPKLAPIFSPKYLGFGEDFEHSSNVPDFYIPKVMLKMNKKHKKTIKQRKEDKKSDTKRLPLSRVVRKSFDCSQTVPQIGLTSDVANEKRYVYESFCTFIEKCINNIEEREEIRPIESTEDLAQLLGLSGSPNDSGIGKTSAFVDLLKIIEFSTPDGPTTLHLLAALHLCDCREHNLWERIKAAINLLSLEMKTSKAEDKSKTDTESESTLNMQNFKTLLWYSLGLQQFNDSYFINQNIDFEYVKKNMKTLFKRAVSENAESLE